MVDEDRAGDAGDRRGKDIADETGDNRGVSFGSG
jgi:hypothetical protein